MLELKNINKSFKNEKVLEDVTLTFEDGKTTVILGPSGAGKSTILRVIDLFEIPESGTVIIDKQQYDFPRKISFKELRKYRLNFGFVFQEYNLFPHFDVLQNVSEGLIRVKRLSKPEALKISQSVISKVGMQGKEHFFPKQLSGGQKQRIGIARALAMNPKYIIYDEPTSALDPELSQEVLNEINDLAKKHKSQILVTHDVKFAQQAADKIVFLEKGRVVFAGDKDKFFNNDSQRIQNFINKLI